MPSRSARRELDFDYSRIPLGYYDRIARGPKGIRRLWHVSKFERVIDQMPAVNGGALLDVGCFAGSLLSMVPAHRFARQVGIDILPEQIAYATQHYGAPHRSFRVATTGSLVHEGERFECVTLVEVLEHLRPDAVRDMLRDLATLLAPGGTLILTTPNYASTWPLLERGLEWLSDVTYEEQHLTRFTFYGFERELEAVAPDVWRDFSCVVKTTTHFLTPFLAAISYEAARRLSRVVPHHAWRHPFGNLLFLVLRKR